MFAHLCYLSKVEHYDAVCILYGGEPVCYDNAGAPLLGTVQGLLYYLQ